MAKYFTNKKVTLQEREEVYATMALATWGKIEEELMEHFDVRDGSIPVDFSLEK